MSKILDSKDFGSKIYNRFPLKYREDDIGQNFALKRYIQSLSDGGFKYSIDEMNGILDLVDPVKVDSKILPILFKQYGLEVFNGIPEEYLRYLLPNIGEAWSKKGSLSVVEFVTSSLSGIKTTTNTTYDEQGNPTISVKLEMDYTLGNYFPDASQFNRLLKNFIPYYCDTKLIYSYVFYENPILQGIDKELMKITDRKEDSGLFALRKEIVEDNTAYLGSSILGDFKLGIDKPRYTVGEEVDTHKDILKYLVLEIGIPKSFEKENLRITTKPIHDVGVVKTQDNLKDKVTYYFNEKRVVDLNDYFKREKIAEKVQESSPLKSKEEDLNEITLAPLHDTPKLRGREHSVDRPTNHYIEDSGFKLRRDNLINPVTNAVFGEAIMGTAVFSVKREYADTYQEHLVSKIDDSGILNSSIDTFTNKEYNTLNNSFFTNGLFSYDIITIGDTTEVVY